MVEKERDLVVAVAKDNLTVPELQFIRDDPDGVAITLLEGGFCNYVYRIQSKDKTSSVVMKHAEEAMRLLPEEKVPINRQTLEYNCLQIFEEIYPGSVPTPYCLDTKHNVIAMKDMSGWEMLRDQLERRHVDLEVATRLGELLGQAHHQTFKLNVNDERWTEIITKFRKPEVKTYDRAVLFERPLDENDSVNKISADLTDEYRKYVADYKAAGIDRKLCEYCDMEICLIHGDCHHGAIFVKDGNAALFDFEFAFLGHPSINLAFVLVGYIVQGLLEYPREVESSIIFRQQCMKAVQHVLEGYINGFTDPNMFTDLTLFVGGLFHMISVFSDWSSMRKLQQGDRRAMLQSAHHILMSHTNIQTKEQFLTFAEQLISGEFCHLRESK